MTDGVCGSDKLPAASDLVFNRTENSIYVLLCFQQGVGVHDGEQQTS